MSATCACCNDQSFDEDNLEDGQKEQLTEIRVCSNCGAADNVDLRDFSYVRLLLLSLFPLVGANQVH